MNAQIPPGKFASLDFYQPLLLAVAERFNLSFSLHGTATTVELFHIHYLLRSVYSRVSGALPLFVLFNATFHVFSVSSVITAVFTKKHVNVIMHPSSTHS